MKKWEILESQKSKVKSQKTDEDILKILLENRGIKKEKEINKFLDPKLEDITLGSAGISVSEMKKAAVRIKKAITDKQSIVVFTDYDADGITSGAIIWETLFALGAEVMPYVPHRVNEGYGLSRKGIDAIKNQFSVNLLITVDHGVTAHEKIKYAKSLGIDTIIIDHHLLPKKLPDTVALVHTAKLCSGGIAWIFSNYLYSEFGKVKAEDKKTTYIHNRNLDLAALATIADLVPLTDANRIIVKYGLDEINKTKRIGLDAMIKDAGLIKGKIDVYEVGHMIAPRINAMGRMTHALDALRLICTKDKERAKSLAGQISVINRERQQKTVEAMVLGMEMVRREKREKLIFISHKEFGEGIIGLVAGKMVEEFYLPSIVVSEGEILSKASARSVHGYNIVELIREAQELIEDIGGHPMAAGFTVATKNLKALKNKLTNIVAKDLKEENLVKKLKIDTVLPMDAINDKLYKTILRLKPFGMGNPEPLFASYQVEVIGVSRVGKENKHLKLRLKKDGSSHIDAIGFHLGEFFPNIEPGTKIDIVFRIVLDTWNGNNRLQLQIKDVKFLH